MSINDQVKQSRSEVVTDSFEMSIGELISMFKAKEIIIKPAYQRLFRWDETRKTRFIESIILGIPTPSIFVFQNEDGVWELVDGLQRISTILQFAGELKDKEPLVLEGTNKIPALRDKTWSTIDQSLQLYIKRTRIRVEILKSESDINAKYELFQRLNTGGASLTEQEVRTCVMIMLNEKFYNWVEKLSKDTDFRATTPISQEQENKQYNIELVVRFICYRNVPYTTKVDLHEYLDKAIRTIIVSEKFDQKQEALIFKETFKILNNATGKDTFLKYDGNKFKGQLLITKFETIALGVAHNLSKIKKLPNPETFIIRKIKTLENEELYKSNSGSGVRASSRLSALLKFGKRFFAS